MDRAELVEALRAAQVPDALYDIPGVHDIRIQPDAYFYLRPDVGGWVVGQRERARHSVLGRFAAESQACDFLYSTLTAEVSSVPAGDADRVREVLARRDEILRDAWRAYRRTLRRNQEKDPPPEDPGLG